MLNLMQSSLFIYTKCKEPQILTCCGMGKCQKYWHNHFPETKNRATAGPKAGQQQKLWEDYCTLTMGDVVHNHCFH
jgi:hypothetical protein